MAEEAGAASTFGASKNNTRTSFIDREETMNACLQRQLPQEIAVVLVRFLLRPYNRVSTLQVIGQRENKFM